MHNEEMEVVDETQLLELAEKQGLGFSENVAEEEVAEASNSTSGVELTEEQKAELMAGMQTILFMSDRPVSLPKLRSVLNPEVSLSIYRELMARLREQFSQDLHGIEIAEVSLGFQIRTKPHMAQVLRKMVKTQPLKLSPTSMEVLAITAYKQPLTKDEIDQIRGVDSGYVLRNLMEKRLVKIIGRSDLPGRPMLYGTTHEFLELFSLKDLKSLPPLHEIEAMVAASEVGLEEKQAQIMEGFGAIVSQDVNKMLFEDPQSEAELESLRSEIASIKTSTPFIEDQKRKEKITAELIAQGMTPEQVREALVQMEAVGIYKWPLPVVEGVPTESPAAEIVSTPIETAAVAEEHVPSPELVAQAEEAQWERHAEAISQAATEAAAEIVTVEAVQVAQDQIFEQIQRQAQDEALNPESVQDVDPAPEVGAE